MMVKAFVRQPPAGLWNQAGRPLGVPYERLVEHIQIDGADRFSRFLILAFIGFLVASLVIFLGCILVVIAALIGFDQFIILRGPVGFFTDDGFRFVDVVVLGQISVAFFRRDV